MSDVLPWADRLKQLGRPKKELDLYARRALNYKNLYDKETKLMRGKNENGDSWLRSLR